MPDMSYLDKKYFIDETVFNCPFCNRKNVGYNVTSSYSFDWSNEKECYVYLTQCSSCLKEAMHLSFEPLHVPGVECFQSTVDLDAKIFYSVPTSFHVLDERIPSILRELISEAEGSLKMNFLTGASACMRKSIYELLILEKVQSRNYDDRIKELKTKYTNIDEELFDVLAHIQQMTSDKVHEQSWDKWDSRNLTLIIETLKSILYEIYVLPAQKKERTSAIQQLRQKVLSTKKGQDVA